MEEHVSRTLTPQRPIHWLIEILPDKNKHQDKERSCVPSPSSGKIGEMSKSLIQIGLEEMGLSFCPVYPQPYLYHLYLHIANDVLSIWGSLIFYPFYYRSSKRTFKWVLSPYSQTFHLQPNSISYACFIFLYKRILCFPECTAMKPAMAKLTGSLRFSGIIYMFATAFWFRFLLSGRAQEHVTFFFQTFHFARTSISLTHPSPPFYSAPRIGHVSIYAPEDTT